MEFFFYVPLFLILYTWIGYPVLLWMRHFARIGVPASTDCFGDLPSVTVAVTVHNEEKLIRRRLDNLAALNYGGSLTFLIVSDGSTDETDRIVEEYALHDRRFQLYRAQRVGKSAAQNQALQKVSSDFVVLGDADCLFAPDYVQATLKHFADPQVGCVTGNLLLVTEDGNIAGSLGLYWRFERLLRYLESRCGLLATASGQCMAIRRSAFTPFEPVYGDDCVIPLDMALKGYRTIYAREAIAYGSMPDTSDGELRARIRMTTRNLNGTLSRWALLNPVRFPGVAWALVSHKLFRWFTSVFLVWLLLASVSFASHGGIFLLALLGQAAIYLLAGTGWILDLSGKRAWPLSSQAYSFVLANVGFSLGLVAAIQRHRIAIYK